MSRHGRPPEGTLLAANDPKSQDRSHVFAVPKHQTADGREISLQLPNKTLHTHEGVSSPMTETRPNRTKSFRLALAAGLLTGTGLILHNWPAQAQDNHTTINQGAINQAEGLSEAFKQAARIASASVVNIRSMQKPEVQKT